MSSNVVRRQYMFLVLGGVVAGILIGSIPSRLIIGVILVLSFAHISLVLTATGLGQWPEDELKVVWWNTWMIISVIMLNIKY
jgi:hypothetical protein